MYLPAKHRRVSWQNTGPQDKARLWLQVGGEGSDKLHSKEESEEWQRAANVLAAQMRSKQGLEIGPCHLMLHVRPCQGLMRQLDGTVEKRFSKAQMTYPIQVGCSLVLPAGRAAVRGCKWTAEKRARQVVTCQAADPFPGLQDPFSPHTLSMIGLLAVRPCQPVCAAEQYDVCKAGQLHGVSVCCDCRPR